MTGQWNYFAFGSNLHHTVLEGRRQVSPLAESPGYVDDYRLAFNILGFGPVEPSFASIEPATGDRVRAMGSLTGHRR